MNFKAVHWRTTIIGVALAAFAFISQHPQYFPNHLWIVDVAKFAMAGGLAGLGLTTADSSNVTRNT